MNSESTAVVELNNRAYHSCLNMLVRLPNFVSHWEEAQRRFGPENVGSTVKDFISMNTKFMVFNPWTNNNESRVLSAGSDDPVTYDQLLLMVQIDNAKLTFFTKCGRWLYRATPPKPGTGLQMEEWECVAGYVARFTMPFGWCESESGDEEMLGVESKSADDMSESGEEEYEEYGEYEEHEMSEGRQVLPAMCMIRFRCHGQANFCSDNRRQLQSHCAPSVVSIFAFTTMPPRSATAESAHSARRPRKKSGHKLIQLNPPQWPRAATSQPSTDLTRFDPTDRFVHRAVDSILDTFENDLNQYWATAKERFGVANAGATVEEFVKMNTKVKPHSSGRF
ncbi:hypothetical protein OF83DRAFT_688568 [Amylostereum chailletii]|nr:hypothetical protein OF83DRAFT_688568 [Amylostereum chailletii]